MSAATKNAPETQTIAPPINETVQTGAETLDPIDQRIDLLNKKADIYIERMGVSHERLAELRDKIETAQTQKEKSTLAQEMENILGSQDFENKIEKDEKDPLLVEKAETAFTLIKEVQTNPKLDLNKIKAADAGPFITNPELQKAIKKNPQIWAEIKSLAIEGSDAVEILSGPERDLSTAEGQASAMEATGRDASKLINWAKENPIGTAAIMLGTISIVAFFLNRGNEKNDSSSDSSSTFAWITAGLGAALGIAAWQENRVQAGLEVVNDLRNSAMQKVGIAGEAASGALEKGKGVIDNMMGTSDQLPTGPEQAEGADYEVTTELNYKRIKESMGSEQAFAYRLLREFNKPGVFSALNVSGRKGLWKQENIDKYLTRLEGLDPAAKLDPEELNNIWWAIKSHDAASMVVSGGLGVLTLGGSFAMKLVESEQRFLQKAWLAVREGDSAEIKDASLEYTQNAIFVGGTVSILDWMKAQMVHGHEGKMLASLGKGIRYGAGWPVYGIKATGMAMEAGANKLAGTAAKPQLLGKVKYVGKALHVFGAAGETIAKLEIKTGAMSLWKAGKWVSTPTTFLGKKGLELGGKAVKKGAEKLATTEVGKAGLEMIKREFAKRAVGEGTKKFFKEAAVKVGAEAAAKFIAERAAAAGLSNAVPIAGQVASIGITLWTIGEVGFMAYDAYDVYDTHKEIKEHEKLPEKTIQFDPETEKMLAGANEVDQIKILSKLAKATLTIEREGMSGTETYFFENGQVVDIQIEGV